MLLYLALALALAATLATPMLAGLAIIRRRPPSPLVWVAVALLPAVFAPPETTFAAPIGVVLLSAGGWTLALLSLRRLRRPRPVALWAIAAVWGAGWWLGIAMGPAFGLASIGLAWTLLPLGSPRLGPPTPARTSASVLLATAGALVLHDVTARLADGPPWYRPVVDLPAVGGWSIPVGLASAAMVGALALARTRRELLRWVVVAGLATIAIAPNAWRALPAIGLLLQPALPEAGGLAFPVRDLDARSWDTEVIPGDTPLASLRERLSEAPLDIAAQVTRPGDRVEFGFVRLDAGHLVDTGGAPGSGADDRIPLSGTLAEAIAACDGDCRVALDLTPEREQRERDARDRIRALHQIEFTNARRALDLAGQLRAPPGRTRARAEANGVHRIPWEMLGQPFRRDGLQWDGREAPTAELEVVRVIGREGYPEPYTMNFDGRVSMWAIRPTWQTNVPHFMRVPTAVDPRLGSVPDYTLTVHAGRVVLVSVDPPEPAAIRAYLGITRTPRAPIPDAVSPLDAGACGADPPSVDGGCLAGALTCGSDVVATTRGAPLRPAVKPDVGRDTGGARTPRSAHPAHVWRVEIPARTVAELVGHFPCVTHAMHLQDDGGGVCPPAHGRWTRSTRGVDAASFRIASGTHTLVIEATDAPAPYALTVRCSSAGDGVDTGAPPP